MRDGLLPPPEGRVIHAPTPMVMEMQPHYGQQPYGQQPMPYGQQPPPYGAPQPVYIVQQAPPQQIQPVYIVQQAPPQRANVYNA